MVDNANGEVVFNPPPAGDLPKRLKALFKFANEESPHFIHPFIKASILHFWLAYEHPFVDGNGRTARAILYWYMLKHDYWLFEFLSISSTISASTGQYYRSFLHSEYDNNDLTYSVLYLLDATGKAFAHLHTKIRRKQKEQQDMVAILKTIKDVNHRQRSLLHHALAHPMAIYTFESHKNSNGISYQTARTDLLALSEKKLLDLVQDGKQMNFFPSKRLQRIAERGAK